MEECPVGTHPDRFDIDPEEGELPGQRDLLEGAVVGLGDNGQQRLFQDTVAMRTLSEFTSASFGFLLRRR